jgi:hypothetical protein
MEYQELSSQKIVSARKGGEYVDVNPKNWTDPLASIIIWKKSRIGGYNVR